MTIEQAPPFGAFALTGQTLGERYAIRERLGSGGSASVYRARDARLNRDVAVKVLHPYVVEDGGTRARFEREARCAASLPSHPHVVAVYDVGRDGDIDYLVMELARGSNLKSLLAQSGQLAPRRAASIAGQVASALAFLHQNGLVHRDVKPQNIVVGADDKAKLTDLGIARHDAYTQITAVGTVLGTAAYLAPEQWRGGEATAQSDVYSLGSVLYEMLTGRAPFAGEDPSALAYQHMNEPATAPAAIVPGVSPALSATTLRALAKNPQDRFASAAAFEEALRRQDASNGDTQTQVLTAVPAGRTGYLGARVTQPRTGIRAESTRPWRFLGLAGMIGLLSAALALAAWGALGAAGPAPRHTGSATGSHRHVQPTPTPQPPTPRPPTPTPAPPPTFVPPPASPQTLVTARINTLRGAIASGVAAGSVDPGLATDLNHSLDDLQRAAASPKPGDLTHKAQDLQKKVSDHVRDGKISSSESGILGSDIQALLLAAERLPQPVKQPGHGHR